MEGHTKPDVLPAGFEFVVSAGVPRGVGVRRLNGRTFEVHPETYRALLAVFGNKEAILRVLASPAPGLGQAVRAAADALARLARALGKPPALGRPHARPRKRK